MKLKNYLQEQQHLLWLTLGNLSVISVVLFLYHITLRAILYPALLCLCILVLYMVVDFYRKKAHLRQLQDAFSGVSDSLPEPKSLLEVSYQTFLTELRQQQKELTLRQDMRYQDMIDYYTTWAHQIKTPIAAMRLKLDNEDSPLSRQLNSDLLRTQQYVEMVMVYLRLDAPTHDYILKSCSLDDLVRKSISTFASEFVSRGLALHYQPLEGTLITDEKWFCFVLEQLLSNALKYTRSGSISITCRGQDTLCITDTGIGIAPEDLPRIFQKGYTGFNGHADRQSSGLGLYLCKRVCDGLNIPIEAASELGKGTTICLHLNQYPLKTE